MAESTGNLHSVHGVRSHLQSNEFDQKDFGGVQPPENLSASSKFDLGPRWSGEEVQVFFESKLI